MKVIGIVGGVAGGFVFGQLFSVDVEAAAAADLVLTLVGAWAGSVLLNDAYGLVRGRAQD
jgi:uncharacterized membrane protein YeaQ/YmgE (transglycosylase-associated protein family)